jgi:hypothetical protein
MRCTPSKERIVLDYMIRHGLWPKQRGNFVPLADFTDGVLERLSAGQSKGAKPPLREGTEVDGSFLHHLIEREACKDREIDNRLIAEANLIAEYVELSRLFRRGPTSEDQRSERAAAWPRFRELRDHVRAALLKRHQEVEERVMEVIHG